MSTSEWIIVIVVFLTAGALFCLRRDLCDELPENIIQRQAAELALLAGADGHAVLLDLIVTDDEHIRDAVKAGILDLRTDILVLGIDRHAHTGSGLRMAQRSMMMLAYLKPSLQTFLLRMPS